MQIGTTVTLQSDFKFEHKKDREYYLKCYRLKRAIKTLNRISMDFAMGRIYPDDDSYAAIYGITYK